MKKKILFGIIGVVALVLGSIAFVHFSTPVGTEEWRNIAPQVFPQLVPATNKDQVNIVNEQLSTTIDIAFVIDKVETYDFIMHEDLDSWEIEVEDLKKAAMKNLEKKAKATVLQAASVTDAPTEKYIIVEVDDGYAAARLLSPHIRKQVSKELGANFVAGIPTRDFLIFWHEKFTLFEKFAEQVELEYSEGGTYRLTPNIFAVSRNQIGMLKKK